MSKSKNHSSELEQLRQELRNLKSENRHLKKQLSRAGKSLHRLSDLEEIAAEVELEQKFRKRVEELVQMCEECQAPLNKVAGKSRILHRADCSKRKKK